MKRCLEEGEAVMAVITSLRELISCLFIDVVVTCVEICGTFWNFLQSLAVVDVVKVVVSQLVMIRLSLQNRQKLWKLCSRGR